MQQSSRAENFKFRKQATTFAKQMVQLEGEEDLVGARELPLGVLGENENHEQGQ